MTSTYKKCQSVCLGVFAVAYSLAATAVQVEPPKTPTVDKFGVNLQSGQVSNTLPTVSIGGAMGLSHTISIYANELDYPNGFKDKYIAWGGNIIVSTQATDSPQQIYRVHDWEDSADFAYYLGSTMQTSPNQSNPVGTYTYRPIGDERHSLVRSGSTLIWTKPDGTVDTFWIGSSGGDAAQSVLTEVKYPNGFIISTSGLGNVRTNTGFQLKRFYAADTRPLDKPDRSMRNAPQASAGWYDANPKYIRAINNAYDYCADTGPCALTKSWPTATFTWPAGMPRTMFLDTKVYSDVLNYAGSPFSYHSSWSVTDAGGATTTYYYKSYDLAYGDGGTVVSGYTAGQDYSPRLVGIKPANSDRVRFTYSYKNNFDYSGLIDYRLDSSGLVTGATNMDQTVGYDMQSTYYTDPLHQATGPTNINRVQIKIAVPFPPGQPGSYRGALYSMGFDQGTLYFEHLPRNFPEHFDKFQPPSEWYTYTRSNLTKIAYGSTTGPTVQAQYPPDCVSTPASYCNKPVWTRDQRNNQTDYTYHPQSGQIASITSPANEQGVRPQTRYEYTQLSAHYYNGGSSKITGSPIWMKTAERSCANSSFSNACTGGDEVVTRFYYNSDNLFLTSTTVTDQKTGKTLTTCFQYDIYGNQIGKTEPKGATTCN